MSCFLTTLYSNKGHSGPGGLALAYLNEYSIVSAAFTLHSSELKVIKVRTNYVQNHITFIFKKCY